MTIGGPTVLVMFLLRKHVIWPRDNMLTKEQVSQVRRLIHEGLPVAHIAKKIGCGRTRVYKEKGQMDSEARRKDRKAPLEHKVRHTDAVGGFRERARKIELVEHLRGIKKKAEEIASGGDLADSEREGLVALARQCDEAIDAMPSFSATDAALIGRELDARLAETSRKVSTRIDLDHNLAVVRGRLGQLNRQLKALERKRQKAKGEVQSLEQQIEARMQALGLTGELAEAKQVLAGLQELVNARRSMLRDLDGLIELERQRAFNEWLGEMVSSYPMNEVERNALEAITLRRMQISFPESSSTDSRI